MVNEIWAAVGNATFLPAERKAHARVRIIRIGGIGCQDLGGRRPRGSNRSPSASQVKYQLSVWAVLLALWDQVWRRIAQQAEVDAVKAYDGGTVRACL